MEIKPWPLFHTIIAPLIWVLFISLLSGLCLGGILNAGKISPGFEGTHMKYVDNDGKFLQSNNGEFVFGFISTRSDSPSYLLGIVHKATATIVWTANRASPVSDSDNYVFDENGNTFLQRETSMVWSTNTSNKGVSSMELLDTGNLVLLGKNENVVWQSYSYPTDTLLPNQEFTEGMKLISEPSPINNLTYVLEIKSGDVILSADFPAPQIYWSLQKDNHKTINKDGGLVASASISENSWRFYDQNKSLLWQFIFSGDSESNTTWVAVLGNKGFLTFSGLRSERASVSPIRIPQESCGTPQPCGPYYICSGDNNCHCPSVLSSRSDCKPRNILSSCNNSSKSSVELVKADHGIHYFALDFLPPSSRTDLYGCRDSCLGNCSCLAMFFHNNSGNCFLLDNIGSFEASDTNSEFVSYIKVSTAGGRGSKERSNNHTIVVVVVVLSTLFVTLVVAYVVFRFYRRKPKLGDSSGENSEEDIFLANLTGVPTRFSYTDLERATSNFSVKLGQGGFGSVYKGVLPDGTHVAVKKLEAIGQGKKEFRAEVSIIGSIHHHHLVRLKGFCAEGSHKLLVYEYMANGSLDKWLFKKSEGEFMLDWNTRFNIALGTAKGLAYLHEDCDSKIVHCDIKPENVLLDDRFLAKVSDFGLAKLMTRDQSHVFTTLRGTRGYLAPEWITNTAISEKSDVYSYGMVLLEIIGGRKNYDPNESSGKSHFPSFAFKMMEEGKLRDIVDSKMDIDENDERLRNAVKVSFWCLQDDMCRRPYMSKVVQMLEGLCVVPEPPTCSPLGFRLYSSLFQPNTEGTEPPNSNNKASYVSAARLSGPR